MATRARWSPATDSNIASHRARNSATAKTWVNVARARACLAWVPGARPAMAGGEGAPARAAGVLRTAAGCAARFPTPPPFGCYSCACPILGMAGPEHQPKVFNASLTGDIIIGQPPAGAGGLCPGGGLGGARGDGRAAAARPGPARAAGPGGRGGATAEDLVDRRADPAVGVDDSPHHHDQGRNGPHVA